MNVSTMGLNPNFDLNELFYNMNSGTDDCSAVSSLSTESYNDLDSSKSARSIQLINRKRSLSSESSGNREEISKKQKIVQDNKKRKYCIDNFKAKLDAFYDEALELCDNEEAVSNIIKTMNSIYDKKKRQTTTLDRLTLVLENPDCFIPLLLKAKKVNFFFKRVSVKVLHEIINSKTVETILFDFEGLFSNLYKEPHKTQNKIIAFLKTISQVTKLVRTRNYLFQDRRLYTNSYAILNKTFEYILSGYSNEKKLTHLELQKLIHTIRHDYHLPTFDLIRC